MTDKELLRADLLDIVFQDRNKMYGAYALRKHYNVRLVRSLAITLSAVLLAILITSFKSKEKKSPVKKNDASAVQVIQVVIPEEEKPPVEEKLPEIKKATVDHQPIIVVPDDKADPQIPEQDLIKNSLVSNITLSGAIDSGRVQPKETGEGTGGVVKSDPVPEKKAEPLPSYPPSFPEGQQAWIDYLRRYLQTPDELEPGQRVEVRVKFFVEVDGGLSRFEIVHSGGKEFDREVLRVMKKMPKWEPAVQAGQKIAVSFTQPVIFVGQEE